METGVRAVVECLSDSPTPSVKAEEDSECPICMEPIKIINKALVAKCLHEFCDDCLKQWVTQSDNPCCPICKGDASSFIHRIKEDDRYSVFTKPPPPVCPLSQALHDLSARMGVLRRFAQHMTHHELLHARELARSLHDGPWSAAAARDPPRLHGRRADASSPYLHASLARPGAAEERERDSLDFASFGELSGTRRPAGVDARIRERLMELSRSAPRSLDPAAAAAFGRVREAPGTVIDLTDDADDDVSEVLQSAPRSGRFSGHGDERRARLQPLVSVASGAQRGSGPSLICEPEPRQLNANEHRVRLRRPAHDWTTLGVHMPDSFLHAGDGVHAHLYEPNQQLPRLRRTPRATVLVDSEARGSRGELYEGRALVPPLAEPRSMEVAHGEGAQLDRHRRNDSASSRGPGPRKRRADRPLLGLEDNIESRRRLRAPLPGEPLGSADDAAAVASFHQMSSRPPAMHNEVMRGAAAGSLEDPTAGLLASVVFDRRAPAGNADHRSRLSTLSLSSS